MSIYYGFKNLQDVAGQFGQFDWSTGEGIPPEGIFPLEHEVLFALYSTPSWEGYAFVLFKKDGKLYEVHGSHCSCYGLEDQWTPEETSKTYLQHMITEGRLPWYDDGEFEPNAREDFIKVVQSL